MFKFAKHVVQLLAPTNTYCLFCKKTKRKQSQCVSHHSGFAQLPHAITSAFFQAMCSECLAIIPWLNNIKCRICGRGMDCRDCSRRTNAYFIANRSAVQYSNTMREWLAQYKYRGDERLEPLLTAMMVPIFNQLTQQIYSRSAPTDVSASPAKVWDALVFVPVSAERLEERGFNQAERLASGLALHTGIPTADLLARERHTEKQSFKSRMQRIQDSKQLFYVRPESFENLIQSTPSLIEQIRNQSIVRLLLIDDIYTTGSTIDACSKALQEYSPFQRVEIYSLTWARS